MVISRITQRGFFIYLVGCSQEAVWIMLPCCSPRCWKEGSSSRCADTRGCQGGRGKLFPLVRRRHRFLVGSGQAEGRGSGWTQPQCRAEGWLHGSPGAGFSLAASKAYPRTFTTGTGAGFACVTEKHLVIRKHARRLEGRILM